MTEDVPVGIAACIVIPIFVSWYRSARKIRARSRFPGEAKNVAVELEALPPDIRNRISQLGSDLGAIGYKLLGHCATSDLNKNENYRSIFLRGCDIAEIVFVRTKSGKEYLASMALGREYSNGASFYVTSAPILNPPSKLEKAYVIPRLKNIVVLDSIYQELLARSAPPGEPVLPDDAAKYAQAEVARFVESGLSNRRLRYDKSRELFQATWRHAFATAIRTSLIASHHNPAHVQLEIDDALRDLGIYGDAPASQGNFGFPVILPRSGDAKPTDTPPTVST